MDTKFKIHVLRDFIQVNGVKTVTTSTEKRSFCKKNFQLLLFLLTNGQVLMVVARGYC